MLSRNYFFLEKTKKKKGKKKVVFMYKFPRNTGQDQPVP